MRRFLSGCTVVDSRLFISIYRLSGGRKLDKLFYSISRIGDGWLYGAIFTLYLILRTENALRLLPAVAAAFILESVVYFLIKKNVKRIRPFKSIEGITSLIIPPDEFSFPSGHTAAAAVFAVLCSRVFPQYAPFLYLYVASVGFSRVYNGVHYPGDVFAGTVLGAVCANIGLFFF